MNDDVTSLDRLHDIVVPQPVPWWPMASGWYVLLAVVAVLLGFWVVRSWRRWRAKAYRRAALRQLNLADSAAAIAEVLRRTALAIAPRSTVAPLTGSQWPDWLTTRSPDPMPNQVRKLLAVGAYRESEGDADVGALREYATSWIRHHRSPVRSDS